MESSTSLCNLARSAAENSSTVELAHEEMKSRERNIEDCQAKADKALRSFWVLVVLALIVFGVTALFLKPPALAWSFAPALTVFAGLFFAQSRHSQERVDTLRGEATQSLLKRQQYVLADASGDRDLVNKVIENWDIRLPAPKAPKESIVASFTSRARKSKPVAGVSKNTKEQPQPDA